VKLSAIVVICVSHALLTFAGIKPGVQKKKKKKKKKTVRRKKIFAHVQTFYAVKINFAQNYVTSVKQLLAHFSASYLNSVIYVNSETPNILR